MKEISFTLGDSEFDKFMNYLKKSLKSANNVQSKEIESDNGIYGLTLEHKNIVDERRRQHLSGESESYTFEEVKARARQALQAKKENR